MDLNSINRQIKYWFLDKILNFMKLIYKNKKFIIHKNKNKVIIQLIQLLQIKIHFWIGNLKLWKNIFLNNKLILWNNKIFYKTMSLYNKINLEIYLVITKMNINKEMIHYIVLQKN